MGRIEIELDDDFLLENEKCLISEIKKKEKHFLQHRPQEKKLDPILEKKFEGFLSTSIDQYGYIKFYFRNYTDGELSAKNLLMNLVSNDAYDYSISLEPENMFLVVSSDNPKKVEKQILKDLLDR